MTNNIKYIAYTLYILHTLRTKFYYITFGYHFLSYSLISSIIAYIISTNFLSFALSGYNT
jgi:hypothetical protein